MMISFRKADLLDDVEQQRVVEQQRQDEINRDKITHFPLDTLPQHPQISKIIRAACDEFVQNMSSSWEAWGREAEPLEHRPHTPGFFNHTNGGWRGKAFIDVSYMSSSGGWPSNKEFSKDAHEKESNAYKEGLNNFIMDHNEELVAAGLDPKIKKNLKKINYGDLYDAGQGTLAESLSEAEMTELQGYTYEFYFEVFYYNPTNDEKENKGDGLPEIRVQAGVCEGFDLLAVGQQYSFSTLSQLEAILKECVEKATEAVG